MYVECYSRIYPGVSLYIQKGVFHVVPCILPLKYSKNKLKFLTYWIKWVLTPLDEAGQLTDLSLNSPFTKITTIYETMETIR